MGESTTLPLPTTLARWDKKSGHVGKSTKVRVEHSSRVLDGPTFLEVTTFAVATRASHAAELQDFNTSPQQMKRLVNTDRTDQPEAKFSRPASCITIFRTQDMIHQITPCGWRRRCPVRSRDLVALCVWMSIASNLMSRNLWSFGFDVRLGAAVRGESRPDRTSERGDHIISCTLVPNRAPSSVQHERSRQHFGHFGLSSCAMRGTGSPRVVTTTA